MKKALLIATTLMALAIPAQATQINQADQDNQAKMSQQTQAIQPIKCTIINGRKVCPI